MNKTTKIYKGININKQPLIVLIYLTEVHSECFTSHCLYDNIL